MEAFHRSRETPKRWQEELEAIVPRTERLPWLLIVWEPGMEYDPVQRWIIREMVPTIEHVHIDLLDELKHSIPPREKGEWVLGPDNVNRWVSDSMVSQQQWDLFHEYGCYSQPFWVIQGPNGGHQYSMSRPMENYFTAKGMEDPRMPPMGELPYAEWDIRVADKIMEFDKLQKFQLEHSNKRWDERMKQSDAGIWVAEERRDEEEKWADRHNKWMDTQLEDALQSMSDSAMFRIMNDAPRGDRMYNEDEDRVEQQYAESGLQTRARRR